MTIESMRLRLRFDSSYSFFRFALDLYDVFKLILKEKWFPFHGHIEQKISERHKLFIWGASQRGREALHYFKKNKIHTSCFLDKDPFKHGKMFEGLSVENPNFLCTFSQKEKPFIVIASIFKDEISAELDELGYHEKIDYFIYPL